VVILSEGVLIGDATDFFILGTTYRQAESALNKQLSAAMATINNALQNGGCGPASGILDDGNGAFWQYPRCHTGRNRSRSIPQRCGGRFSSPRPPSTHLRAMPAAIYRK
jgi:hypothetical protein